MKNYLFLFTFIVSLFGQPLYVYAQTDAFNVKEVDSLVHKVLATFKVPGAAVGVIKDGEVLLNKGYGLQDINKEALTVDKKTLFKIASTSKAFTAAALAMLVDQQKITWESKVVDIIPQFALYDQWVTKEFTIADLLTHRSGLARFAGDLMLWPEPAGFSRDEIIRNLKHLRPASGFRSEYAYDNLLYIVAGEVVAKVSGLSWEQFVEQQIFSALEMKRCFAGAVPKKQMTNIAQPHGLINDKPTIIKRNQTYDKESVMAAAGGIKCSVNDLLVWVQTQLNRGISPADVRIFSDEQSKVMWSPHTILSVSENDKKYHNTNFRSYGLGWRLADTHGYKRVSHTGSLSGNLSQITLIPELNLGVVVLINQNSTYARNTIMNSIVQSFINVEQRDWLTIQTQRQQERLDRLRTKSAQASLTHNVKPLRKKVTLPLQRYVGLYQDPWFGQVNISIKNKQLYFESLKSTRMHGHMIENEGNEFIVWYDDRSLEADAFARFTVENNQVVGLTMDRLSDDIDASFDYIDLNFTRITE
ncbi:serine hydrolase [Thalassotalea piscium]|uniref:CubicO group peptidase (Beta-lactamase class C family) n=1 Tax=Thalassotalea piscium TaxID=1230533 RepID=A0A7X0TSR6_9GAMM|nr:serine hydrolase [Thalassotalea piscium]MBB6542416.1 CubicO group peptidase (beta-lactamase class C family) [Thalassotalea piscium]